MLLQLVHFRVLKETKLVNICNFLVSVVLKILNNFTQIQHQTGIIIYNNRTVYKVAVGHNNVSPVFHPGTDLLIEETNLAMNEMLCPDRLCLVILMGEYFCQPTVT